MLASLRPEKVWWTAAEVAEARLPDAPATQQGVEHLAKRSGWRSHPEWSRQRSGKGGGWEYNWQLFPIAARRKLLKEATLPDQEAQNASPDLADLQAYYESLPEGVKAKAQHRKKVLGAVLSIEQSGLTRSFAVHQIAKEHKTCTRTIWNWFELVSGQPEADWLYLLAPRNQAGARREPKAQCDPEFMDYLKGLFLQLEGPTFAQAYRDTKKIALNNGWAILCDRTARRRMNEQVPRVVQVYAREGIAGLERCFPPMIRSKLDMHAMEHVNADCHKFDVFTEWEDGYVDRCQIVAFQDIYSGKVLSWRIDHTPNEAAVMSAFGEMVESWGIPEHCTFDNGREFAAKWLSGGVKTRYRGKIRDDDPMGVLPLLGIQIHWATPGHGQAKPVERTFRDFASDIAKDIRFAGAYVGNRPDAKPENYKSRAVPIKDFIRVVDERIKEHNARMGRMSETANGRSFDVTFAESYERSAIRRATDEQKRLWLMGQKTLTMQKNHGRIHAFGNYFWSDWMAEYAGKRVIVRFDIEDLQSGVYIYELTGEFMGFAPCQLAKGFRDLTAAKENARAKAQFRLAHRKMLKAERRLNQKEIAAQLDAIPVPDPIVPENKIVAMHKGEARPIAARATRPAYEDEMTPEQEAEVIAFQEKFYADQKRKEAKAKDEEPIDRYRRAVTLEQELSAGKNIGASAANWLRGYQTTSEYFAHRDMHRDVGDHFVWFE